MDFHEVTKRRRTVRDLADAPVDTELIYRVLEGGLRAPSYNHLREWDFVVVEDEHVRLAIVQHEGLPQRRGSAGLEPVLEGLDRLAKEM